MENGQRQQIEHLARSNSEIKRLYERHRLYELKIAKLSKRSFLTSNEQMELKRIKELKLRGVEKMLRMSSGNELAA